MILYGDKIKKFLMKIFVICIMTGIIMLLVPGLDNRVLGAYIPDENTDYTIDITIIQDYDIDDFHTVAKDYLSYYYFFYDKSGYTSADYKKLTNYYNEAYKTLQNDYSLKSVKSVYKTYLKLIKSIKPTLLNKYQKKMKKKVIKIYNKLVKKYNYSDTNLEILKDIKLAGIEKITDCTIKTAVKAEMNSCISKMKSLKTYIQQVKEDATSFVQSNNNIEQSEKETLIKKINKESKMERIIDLLQQYGYSYEEYIETNPNKLTVKILKDEDKLNEFAENWLKSYPESPGYYRDLNGKDTSYGSDVVKLMIYMLNYNYCNPKETFETFDYTVGYEYVDYANRYLEMCIGGSQIIFKNGKIMDYNSLIIENNDIKGVGQLLNDMEKAIVNNNETKLKKLLVKYYDNYMNKNAVIDRVVSELKKNNIFDSEFNKKYVIQINKVSLNGSNILNIEEEYFLNEYEKKYNKSLK